MAKIATVQKAAAVSNKKGIHIVDRMPTLSIAPEKKPTRQERLAQDVAALSSNPDAIDSSFVITDYGTLREQATAAMGAFASENTKTASDVLDAWTKRKSGGVNTHIFTVHPLMLNVIEGDNRLNTRDFTSADMVERVAEMTQSVAGGVNKPVEVFVQGDRFCIVGGETRFRGVLHAWIRKAQNPALKAPVGIPITLEAPGTNDARRHLNVALSNDQKTMKPVEVAQKYLDAQRSGMTADEIAAYMGKNATHVDAYINMLSMPQAVLNIVKNGMISLSLVNGWWKESGQDTAKTLARIEAADKQRRAAGAKHIMPKHDTEGDEGSDEGTSRTGTGSKGRTASRRSNDTLENVQRNSDMVNAHIVSAKKEVTEDGKFVLIYVPTLEYVGSLAPLTGADIPEKANRKAAA